MFKLTMNNTNQNKLWYHILLAIGVSILLLFVIFLALRLFTRHGKEIEMPDYIGRNASELTQMGKDEGFVFVVDEEVYKEGTTPGTVLTQDPAPHEKVKKGRKVYLTVSAKTPPLIKMPALQDLSLRQAQIMLEAQGLVLDRIIEKTSPYENVVLDVLYHGHHIASGSDIRMGEKITLVVGKSIGSMPDSLDTVD